MRHTAILCLIVSVVCASAHDADTDSDTKSDIDAALANKSLVDVRRCLVWGPGLNADFDVPARYFFFQAIDFNGNNITSSLGEKTLSVQVHSTDGSRVRVWLQVLDRHDGSYIIRYKLYDTIPNVVFEVFFDDKPVADSPYVINGPLHPESCHCPQPNISHWQSVMGCPAGGYLQIHTDLAPFPRVDMSSVAKEAVSRFNRRGSHSLCHYVIKDNKIYRKTYGEHVGFKMFMDSILLSLSRKVPLPDVEFFVNLGDWPLEKKKLAEGPLPIFSWCGSTDTFDIIMPTYDVTDSTLETMGRVSLDLLSVQANTGPPWSKKEPVAFWRGRDSRQERLDLVRMSLEEPKVIDARLTNMFFFKHNVAEHGELVKHISFFDFFKRKYQISVDGTVAAYRLPYLLSGDAVVLKQDSPYYEHFYHEMAPYVHYVPFKRDLSDLREKIQWVKDNDEKAQAIGKAAQQYIRNNLMAGDIFCYHVALLEEFSKRLTRPPQILDDMELVVPEESRMNRGKCECKRKPKTKKKDEL